MAVRKLTEHRLEMAKKLGVKIPDTVDDTVANDLIDSAVAEQKLILAGHGPSLASDAKVKKKS